MILKSSSLSGIGGPPLRAGPGRPGGKPRAMRLLPLLLLLVTASPAWAESGTMASAIADFDGDGNADVVAVRSDRLDLLRGDGRGGFAEPLPLAKDAKFGVLCKAIPVRLDSDGKPDLVVLGLQGATAFLARDGTLERSWEVPDPNIVDIALWPNDRTLALLSGKTLTLRKLSEGGFLGTPRVHELPAEGWTLWPADGNVALGAVGSQSLMWVKPDGSVEQIPMGGDVGGAVAGDFNADGKVDFVSLLHPSIRARNGTGGPILEFPADTVHSGGKVADFDGDGLPDVATLLPDGAVLLRGSRSALLTPPELVGPFDGPTDLAIGDLDGDGRPDLALTSLVRDGLVLFYNEGGGKFRSLVLPLGP